MTKTRPAPSSSAPTPTPTARERNENRQRQNFIWAGLMMAGMIIIGALAVAVLYDPEPTAPPSQSEVTDGRAPDIVPRPNSGRAPEEATDRGGWIQLTVLGAVVVALGGIGVIIARGGGSKARANRAAWRAAADDRNGSDRGTD